MRVLCARLWLLAMMTTATTTTAAATTTTARATATATTTTTTTTTATTTIRLLYDYYTTTTTGVPLGFCPWSRLEDIRRCKKRGKRGLSWTSATKCLAKTVAPGGGARRRTAPAWGLAQFGRRCRWYFRGRGACTQYDPKIILGAKTLDPKGDAYHGSWES